MYNRFTLLYTWNNTVSQLHVNNIFFKKAVHRHKILNLFDHAFFFLKWVLSFIFSCWSHQPSSLRQPKIAQLLIKACFITISLKLRGNYTLPFSSPHILTREIPYQLGIFYLTVYDMHLSTRVFVLCKRLQLLSHKMCTFCPKAWGILVDSVSRVLGVYFFFFLFGHSVACGSSQARDWTCATAVTMLVFNLVSHRGNPDCLHVKSLFLIAADALQWLGVRS